MATSSAAEVPRNIEFLFSLNRLNVAISRAQALALVFASPRLLDVPCRTIEQMRLVNALAAVHDYAADETRGARDAAERLCSLGGCARLIQRAFQHRGSSRTRSPKISEAVHTRTGYLVTTTVKESAAACGQPLQCGLRSVSARSLAADALLVVPRAPKVLLKHEPVAETGIAEVEVDDKMARGRDARRERQIVAGEADLLVGNLQALAVLENGFQRKRSRLAEIGPEALPDGMGRLEEEGQKAAIHMGLLCRRADAHAEAHGGRRMATKEDR